jgi:ribonuclease-3|tara:strand:- start:146 stop:814 length:669 start_codon:yes stop_codon:yes gene_type:complete
METNISKIQKNLNLKFKNDKLLIKCLTHKSFDTVNSNEKLEFLGDRVLGLVISKKLLEIYPNEKEGALDKKLASLVNKNKCFEVGKFMHLEKFIYVRNKKKQKSKIENKIVSDCCEALIGALFLDQGLDITERFILKMWKDHLKASIVTYVDAKTKLQEYSLKKYKSLPIYKLLKNTGPRHKPVFEVGVRIENTKFIVAKGYSKKDAEQKAASLFLKSIGLK